LRKSAAYRQLVSTVKPALERTLLKTIAAVEIVGGAMGAFFVVRRAYPANWAHTPLPIAAFGFCVLAGALLWRDKPAGYPLTWVALVLQLPSVRTATVGYSFACGVGFRVLVGRHGLSWFAFWGSELHLTFAERAPHAVVGVNVVALAFGVVLWVARRAAGSSGMLGEMAPTK
jgi:hypothetical protein